MTQRWDSLKGQAAFGLRLRRSLLPYHRGYAIFFTPCLAPKSALANCQLYCATPPKGQPLNLRNDEVTSFRAFFNSPRVRVSKVKRSGSLPSKAVSLK